MKIGSLVECIGNHDMVTDHVLLARLGYDFPEKGQLYTVRGFSAEHGVLLEELVNKPTPTRSNTGHYTGVKEVAFHRSYFKNVQNPMTVSIEEILNQEHE